MAAPISSEPFIKKMRFQVPESARLGSTMKLSCIYELSGASLHAMKLFKDDKEFYRFTPAVVQPALAAGAAEEQRIAFASPGIKVDLARSTDQDIWIKVLDKRAAGLYKCQVSIEDTFKSISAEKRMDVIERTRTVPNAGGATSSWLGPASSSPSQQQRNAVQQQSLQKNRAQASFMQPQHHQTSSSSSSSAGSNCIMDSKDSCKILSLSLLSTILIIVLMISQQQQRRQHKRQQETPQQQPLLACGSDTSSGARCSPGRSPRWLSRRLLLRQHR